VVVRKVTDPTVLVAEIEKVPVPKVRAATEPATTVSVDFAYVIGLPTDNDKAADPTMSVTVRWPTIALETSDGTLNVTDVSETVVSTTVDVPTFTTVSVLTPVLNPVPVRVTSSWPTAVTEVGFSDVITGFARYITLCVTTTVPPTLNVNAAEPALQMGEVTDTKLAVTVGAATVGVSALSQMTKTVAPVKLLPRNVIFSPPSTAENAGAEDETEAGGAAFGVTATDESEVALSAFLSLVATTVNV
jgi:hypothetical protein